MSRQAFPFSRVSRSKEEARATYTRLSRWYDLVEGPFERRSRERGLALLHVREGEYVLGECARVLRAGGRLSVVALALRDKATPMSRLYAWAHRRFPRLADCRPIPVRQLVEEAGLRVEVADARSIWGLPVDIVLARKDV